MGWFRKNKNKESQNNMDELPELPPLPPIKSQFSEFPKSEEKNELPPLPTFPPSRHEPPIEKIKIKQPAKEISNRYKIPSYSRESEFSPSDTMFAQLTEEIETPEHFSEFPKEKIKITKEPIFIRLDRYQQALSDFQDIKNKIIEIENLLREIKSIREKENLELQEWEREISDTKAKLTRIDRALFEKIGE